MVGLEQGLVSLPEYRLLEAIKKIQYGEIFGVEIDEADRRMDYDLSPAQRDLLQYIRDGAQSIDILTIHNGQPVMAETDFKIDQFRCRKKVKFPTV